MNDELFDMGSAPQDDSLVSRLRMACEEAVEMEAAIQSYEDAAKAARGRLHELRTRMIPEAMAEAGIGDTFSIASGHEIKLAQFVMGSLPKDEEGKKRAFDALIQHGGAELIKTDITAKFGKGEKWEADMVASMLKEQGVEFERKMAVHPATLQSFAREKLKEGDDLPLETLGLTAGTIAKIKAPKE